MPNKIAQEKFKNVFNHILEPIALGIIALLFIIPAITVFNLSPITKTLEKLNVLGAKSQDALQIELVEGRHAIVRNEFLSKEDDDSYTYSTTLTKRNSDVYSKPIIKIKNSTGAIQTLLIYGQTLSPTKTNVSIIANNINYRLQDDKNRTYPQEIPIEPGLDTVLFLSLENFSGIQFSEEFEMSIKVKK
jgi:hypothetical protein